MYIIIQAYIDKKTMQSFIFLVAILSRWLPLHYHLNKYQDILLLVWQAPLGVRSAKRRHQLIS